MTRILIVEDEGDLRELLVDVVHDAGFETAEAATADAAVDLLDLQELDLIVTDINLPGRLDGIDFASAARQRHPGIPVIFISGRPAMLDRARSVCTSASFFQKPFRFNVLVTEICRLATTVPQEPVPVATARLTPGQELMQQAL